MMESKAQSFVRQNHEVEASPVSRVNKPASAVIYCRVRQ